MQMGVNVGENFLISCYSVARGTFGKMWDQSGQYKHPWFLHIGATYNIMCGAS